MPWFFLVVVLSTMFGQDLSSLRELSVTDESDDEASGSRPNILLLVADDLGYNDTNAINLEGAVTPALTQLAEEGVVFVRHYADSTCTPSRVALLSGRLPQRAGFRPTGMEIPPEYITLPESLAQLGYETLLVGKWHAGEQRDQSLPLAQGFDYFFGFHNQWELSGEVSAERRGRFVPGYHDPWLREDEDPMLQYQGHLTDILVSRSADLINQRSETEQPWFLYHGFFAPHAPIEPAERFTARFPNTPEGRYLALLAQLDASTAQLMQALRDSGQLDNTLVLFLSDNGGTNAERDNNFPFYGAKNETYEGSFRTPMIMRWPGQIAPGAIFDAPAMNIDVYPTLLAALDAAPSQALDGRSLWGAMRGEIVPGRARGWEQYTWAADALSISFLSADGRWRLANLFGLNPVLYDLEADPTGAKDVASTYPAMVQSLLGEYWREHWDGAMVPVVQREDIESRFYSGFDLMRVPYQSTFGIGLALGPLPQGAPAQVLAEQPGAWRLAYDGDRALSWHIGDVELHATNFDPQRCNNVVLTGHFRPPAMVRPVPGDNRARLYLGGRLVDKREALAYELPGETLLTRATQVRHGRALFTNTMLGSTTETYDPDVPEQHRPMFQRLRREGSLVFSSVAGMDRRLCGKG